MNLQAAATATLAKINIKHKAIHANRDGKDDKHNSIPHLKWMLKGIEEGYVQHEKGHRWLGWVQANVCYLSLATLTELKRINKES